MNLETLPDTGEIRLLKGSMSILEFAAMQLRILGDVRLAKIVDKQSIDIRRYFEAQETDAGLSVKAVNAYSAMVAALEEVLHIANTVISTSTMPEPAWMEKVKAALALAKGEN